MFTVEELSLPGCYKIKLKTSQDSRGIFVKVFSKEIFDRYGLETSFTEDFYTISKKDVIRGIHFQAPPSAQNKLVTCVFGEVQDVLVDLRKGSPTFGRSESILLSQDRGEALYMPKGIGHGFCTLTEIAVMAYKVSESYNSMYDVGILWSSCGVSWCTSDPIVSARDSSFDSFDKFSSPFLFHGE